VPATKKYIVQYNIHMKESDLKHLTEKIFNDFDTIPNFEVSEDWNEKLMSRINTSRKSNVSIMPIFSIAVFALIICVNAYFILNAFKIEKENIQRNDLQMISSELLINEIR
jgi:hypothetical protein